MAKSEVELTYEEQSYVFDKAEYHYDGDYPEDLPIENAFTHTGFYLTWLAENDLLSDETTTYHRDRIVQLSKRNISPVKLYEVGDGSLIGEILSVQGCKFSIGYFEFETGSYLQDYVATFPDLPSVYHVEPTWENYDKIKPVIDQRYREWRDSQ
ncbi:hypothetical protein [Parvularcula sp. IMCC14364]|uniref:DUF7832 domain-containing protein n=1 Tax=Parvularcula sp. IMCC14364 TaxID=3067902 RepID=UPI0027423CFB|nr:hypothetical protein [Parvularcula sp. IMCC14364]